MALPSGMMWRQGPAAQWMARLVENAAFWVALALFVDFLLVLALGGLFRGSGSRTVFNPDCRSDNARLDHHPLDLVLIWENTTGRSGALVDRGLAYTLRSLEKYKLTKRVHRIHIICPDEPPSYIKSHHPKINIINHAALLPPRTPGGPALPSRLSPAAVQLRLHTIKGLSDWFVVVPVATGFEHLPVLNRGW